MIINEAAWDRVLRVILGVVLLTLAFVGPRSLWGLFGLIPLVTGILGTCPVYWLFGFSTCPVKPPPTQKPA